MLPIALRAQDTLSADQRVASRALRVAKEIAAPTASDSESGRAYREALRVLDSAAAVGVAGPLTHVARAATVSYAVERALRAARTASSPGARCAAARRARALADTLRASVGVDHSPSERAQAVWRRWLTLSDTAAAAARVACPP